MQKLLTFFQQKIPMYLPYFKIDILTSLSFEQLGTAVFFFFFFFFFFFCYCFSYVLLPVPREGCTTCLWSSWFRNVIYVIVTLTRQFVLRFYRMDLLLLSNSLRKHAYANMQKISPPKNRKISDKKL